MNKLFALLLISLISINTVFAKDFRFIQVDGALYNQKNSKQFENLIQKINSEKNVEFVVFTGNNISKPNTALLEEFLVQTKKLKSPYYIVLGQKDVDKRKNLGKKEYIDILSKNVKTHKKIKSPNYVFEKKGQTFIVVDGSKEIIPTSMGYYKKEVLTWLDEQLDLYTDEGKNVIILQHYPIIPPSNKESHYTFKAEEYLKLLSEHNNIQAVIAGHFGVNKEETINGILHISTGNAPIYRIIDILDFDTESPTIWSTIKE